MLILWTPSRPVWPERETSAHARRMMVSKSAARIGPMRIPASSGKPAKGRGGGSWLMMATSLPMRPPISEMARAVQRESPSGRRWEVTAIVRDALILAAMSSLGSAPMSLRLLDQLVDPLLVLRALIQGAQLLGIILQLHAGGTS